MISEILHTMVHFTSKEVNGNALSLVLKCKVRFMKILFISPPPSSLSFGELLIKTTEPDEDLQAAIRILNCYLNDRVSHIKS